MTDIEKLKEWIKVIQDSVGYHSDIDECNAEYSVLSTVKRVLLLIEKGDDSYKYWVTPSMFNRTIRETPMVSRKRFESRVIRMPEGVVVEPSVMAKL
jgi:hypothetical protein